MTDLRKRMLEELERRNYAPSTTCAYLRAVDEFARYFDRPPDQLGLDHIRQYQAYLFREKEVPAQHRDPASRRNPVLLHPDAEAIVERRPDALPKEGDSSSFHPQ